MSGRGRGRLAEGEESSIGPKFSGRLDKAGGCCCPAKSSSRGVCTCCGRLHLLQVAARGVSGHNFSFIQFRRADLGTWCLSTRCKRSEVQASLSECKLSLSLQQGCEHSSHREAKTSSISMPSAASSICMGGLSPGVTCGVATPPRHSLVTITQGLLLSLSLWIGQLQCQNGSCMQII